MLVQMAKLAYQGYFVSMIGNGFMNGVELVLEKGAGADRKGVRKLIDGRDLAPNPETEIMLGRILSDMVTEMDRIEAG